MARMVYVDETGSVGKGANKQPLLTLVAAVVDEVNVQPLAARMRQVAMTHLGWIPRGFEFHGFEIWNGRGPWAAISIAKRVAAYEELIGLLVEFDVQIAHASIHKERLRLKYEGGADKNAYLLAMQFLLEKVDRNIPGLKIVVADENREQQLKAIKLVSDLQDWGSGEVPGHQLPTIIDSLHFASSKSNPGIQIADAVAFIHQRRSNGWDRDPRSIALTESLFNLINTQTRTWRETWPSVPLV